MGKENFQQGIHNYLKNHSMGNTLTPDLWYHLNQVMPTEIEEAGVRIRNKFSFNATLTESTLL